MKSPRRLFMAIAVLGGFPFSAGGEPLELTGYISSEAGTKFLLTDLNDGARSGWLNVGGSFRGFTLAGFDPEHRFISVTKGSETTRLVLKESKTGDVAAALQADKTISISDDGDFFLGDFAVDPGTLAAVLRSVIRAQPKGLVQLRLRWTNPMPATTQSARIGNLKEVIESVRELASEGWRLQMELPRNPK